MGFNSGFKGLMLLINININKAALTLNKHFFVMREMAEDWQQP